MRSYQAPSSKELHACANTLLKSYKNDNSERLKLINLIEKITESVEKNKTPDADKIILGACVYALENITIENDKSWGSTFFTKSSTLKDAIKEALNIKDDTKLSDDKKNLLDDMSRLKYLAAFNKYLKTNQIKIDDQLESKDFVTKIKSVSEKLVKRLDPIIKNTLSKPPTRKALLESFEKLPEKYLSASKNDSFYTYYTGNRSLHEKYALFIKLLNDPKLEKFMLIQSESKEMKYPTEYTVPYAAMMHFRNQIMKEYKVRSAKSHSRLHDMLEEALNIQPDTVIPYSVQDVYLSDLRSVIARLKSDKEAISYLEKSGLKDAVLFLQKTEKDINADLTALCEAEEKSMTCSSNTSANISSVVTWTVRFGVGMMTGRLVAELIPGFGKNIISKAAGVLGLWYYGEKGEIIFRSLGSLVENNLLGTVATVACTVLDPIGTMAGYVVGEAIAFVATKVNDGYRYVVYNPRTCLNLKDGNPDQEWLEVLYDALPDEKRKILLRVEDFKIPEDNEYEKVLESTSLIQNYMKK